MKTDKLILGILAGAAAGALLGVLFAPDNGKKTRKKIADKSNNFGKEAKEKLEDLYKTATSQRDELVNKAKDFASNVK